MGDLDAGYPYKHMRREPNWNRRSGSVPYGTDPMRIWGPHKKIPNPDSRIRIRRHSPLVWYDSRIRTTSGSGIICIFCFDEFFLRIRTQGSGSGFASHPTALEKFKHDIFRRKSGSAPTFEWIRSCFYIFSFKKDAVPGLRIETRIRVRPRTGTVVRCGTAQQRTTDPASASGSAFRTVRYHPHFDLALAHQNKADGCPDPSPVLGSGPFRTGPSHPGIAFE